MDRSPIEKTLALYPLFQSDVHEYTLTVPDSETYLDFKAFVPEAQREGAKVEVTYLSSWGGTGSPSTGIETTSSPT